MARSFTIVTTTDKLKADAKASAKVVFSVINVTSRPVRALASVKAMGDTKREWLSLAGDNQRDIGRGGKEQFTVSFHSSGAPAGKYPFRLDVASAQNPEEDFTKGPTVTIEVSARPTPRHRRRFPSGSSRRR